MDTIKLENALKRHPRMAMAHLPTRIERMSNMSDEMELELWVKRDDCTGIGFGGNKVRQLEYYFGKAQMIGADTVLITGAIQSNYVRTAAAMAARLGLECHVQLEERVPDVSVLYRESGNVLLDKLAGAILHSYPDGEDEAGADAAVGEIAAGSKVKGAAIRHSPRSRPSAHRGARLCPRSNRVGEQVDDLDAFDEITARSALTHAGLLYGLAIWFAHKRHGICVRRDALSQEHGCGSGLQVLRNS